MKAVPKLRTRAWRVISWVLLAAWVGCAVLVMNGIRAGIVTSYGADLTQPAWLYVVTRGLSGPARATRLTRTIGARPEIAAATLFAAAVSTEISQLYWPHGIFRGRFDPLDIIAFGAGIGTCYLLDRFVTEHAPEAKAGLRLGIERGR